MMYKRIWAFILLGLLTLSSAAVSVEPEIIHKNFSQRNQELPRIVKIGNTLYYLQGKRFGIIAKNVLNEKHIILQGKLYLIYSVSTYREVKSYFLLYDGKWSSPVYVGGEYADISVSSRGIFISSSISHQPWVYYTLGSEWKAQKIVNEWSTVTAVYAGNNIYVAWRGEHKLYISIYQNGKFSSPIVVDKEKAPIREIELQDKSLLVKEESLNYWHGLHYKTEDYIHWHLVAEKKSKKKIVESEGSAKVSPRTKKQWTFMVYMDGDNSLSGASEDDIQEMELGYNNAALDEVNLIVLWDKAGYGDTKLMRIYHGGYEDISSYADWMSSEMDMGNVTTLVNFVSWVVKNYPAKHYFVDLWNHGGDYYGAMWDDTSGTHLSLENLREAALKIRKNIGRTVDIWGYDACLMNAGADNYQVKVVADILVASEHTEGGDGWDNTALISNLTGDPYQSALEYAHSFVVHVDDEWGHYSVMSMTALNMTAWDYNFMQAYNFLAQAIRHRAGSENENIKKAFDYAVKADPDYWSTGIDVGDFAKQLIEYVSDATIKYWAERLLENVTGNLSKGIPPSVIDYYDSDTNGRKIVMAEAYSLYLVNTFSQAQIFRETQWDEMINQVYSVGEDDTNEEPLVFITSPSNSAMAKNNETLRLEGTSSDPDGSVVSVEVKIDREDWVLANGTASWTYEINLTAFAPGEHRVFVRSFDGDLYSNYASLTFKINRSIDLTVKEVNLNTTTVNQENGGRVTISAKIANEGNQKVSGIKVAFYYNVFDSEHFISAVNIDALSPGNFTIVNTEWKPVNMLPGNHTIVVYVDPENEILEENEENNELISSPLLIMGYAVEVMCSNNESYTQPLENVTYEITVKNLGTLEDTIHLNIIKRAGWNAELSLSEIKLLPGESGKVYLTVSSPVDANPRDFAVVGIRAVSGGNNTKSDEIYTTTYIRSSILLVDDDGGGPWEIYFEEAMDANGYIYDSWDVFSNGSPSYAALLPYQVVIWNIADQWSDTLSIEDENNLILYLNSGGRLYLSSQDYLYDVTWGYDGNVENTFVNDYLGVIEVFNDISYSCVEGVENNPISESIKDTNLSYPFYNYADEISISSKAMALFLNPEDFAVVGVNYAFADFRTVFTSFSFEALMDANTTKGSELMRNIINWLTEDLSNVPLAPRNLRADNSTGPICLTWDKPLNSLQISGYKVYKMINDRFVVIGETESREFVDMEIEQNKTYIYYVTALNNYGESRPSRLFELLALIDHVPRNIDRHSTCNKS
ncbi:MAG: hypothetical protein J7L63_03120, partial [Thermoplasmata archaeon]|nr:hypothetical protein [Thermoplasmata archaeon]